MTPEHRMTIESNELRRVVNIVKRMGTGADGPAFMRVENDELTLDWYGTAAKSACKSTTPFAVRLPGVSMRTIVRAGKRLAGSVEVSWSSDQLNFGAFSVPCEPVLDDNAKSLPVGATDFELLAIGLTESNNAVAQMGIGEEVERAERRLAGSANHAANALSWLHIDQDVVKSWIEAHVRARAKGQVSFEIAVSVGEQG